MTAIALDIADFRSKFPAYADTTAYPDALLNTWYAVATCYISDDDYGALAGSCRAFALESMLAHLLYLNDAVAKKQPISGLTSQASIDKISTTLTVAPVASQWQWWLSLTPYGAQLWALLQSAAAAGFYVGGLPERSAFRKVGGVW